MKLIPGDVKEISQIKQEMDNDKKVGIASMKWIYEKLAEPSVAVAAFPVTVILPGLVIVKVTFAPETGEPVAVTTLPTTTV